MKLNVLFTHMWHIRMSNPVLKKEESSDRFAGLPLGFMKEFCFSHSSAAQILVDFSLHRTERNHLWPLCQTSSNIAVSSLIADRKSVV